MKPPSQERAGADLWSGIVFRNSDHCASGSHKVQAGRNVPEQIILGVARTDDFVGQIFDAGMQVGIKRRDKAVRGGCDDKHGLAIVSFQLAQKMQLHGSIPVGQDDAAILADLEIGHGCIRCWPRSLINKNQPRTRRCSGFACLRRLGLIGRIRTAADLISQLFDRAPIAAQMIFGLLVFLTRTAPL